MISNIFTYIIASILLNSILNKLELKKKDNIIDYIIISNIYIIILSGIFDYYSITSNNDNIFLIILLQILIRFFYLSIIKERTSFRNLKYDIDKYLITLVSGYFVNIFIINNVSNILPSEEIIKILIWLFIFGYIFLYVKKNIDVKVPTNNNLSYYEDREYIVMQYAKYRNIYNNIVNSKYEDINILLYSIMIYENYNKPELIRKIDIFKYNLFHNSTKFGIMQIERKNPISDIDSIEISKKKLERIYDTSIKIKNKIDIKILIKKYYKKERIDIESIYFIIKEFTKK